MSFVRSVSSRSDGCGADTCPTGGGRLGGHLTALRVWHWWFRHETLSGTLSVAVQSPTKKIGCSSAGVPSVSQRNL